MLPWALIFIPIDVQQKSRWNIPWALKLASCSQEKAFVALWGKKKKKKKDGKIFFLFKAMAPDIYFLIQGRHSLASVFEPRFSTQVYKAFQHIPLLLESPFRKFFLWISIVINTWLIFQERLFNQVHYFFHFPRTFFDAALILNVCLILSLFK